MNLTNFQHKVNSNKFKNVLILGKGKSASSVFDYLKNYEGIDIDIVEEDELDVSKSYDLCITSPGISEFSDFYNKAKKISKEVISEVEFAYRESEKDSLWVAITGTNGKTTTTSLIEHILKSSGVNAVAVGNIGQTCISKVDGNPKVYVCECSSYQLASTSAFCPDASAILNITPDHLSWHKTFENYEQAKFRIFKNSKNREDCLVYLDHSLRKELKVSNFRCVVKTDEDIEAREVVDPIRDDMQIKGEHNYLNAICATAIVQFLCKHKSFKQMMSNSGKRVPTFRNLKKGLLSFSPLEHRIEPCGEFDGVRFFNDSKATNVDSTIKALSAFERGNVILLLGGKDKNSSLKPLFDEIVKDFKSAGGPRVKHVICFGEARFRFYDELKGVRGCGVLIDKTKTLKDAFILSCLLAVSGDAILLSPACASFDEFSSFEQRGEVFKEMVRDL